MNVYFPNIDKIKYEGTQVINPLAFRHYNASEIVGGKTMEEQLRFAVAYWHTMTQDGSDPFGNATNIRTWLTDDPMETAKNRVDAFFEFLVKLGAPLFCFHDIDIAPFGANLKEFFYNQDVIVEKIQGKMEETGKKLLWNTANMFSDPIFMHGASTTNSSEVYARAAAHVKKGIDLNKQLGSDQYVFWGGREGYESLLNTDLSFELDNMARFFHMAVEYAEKIGHKVTFLIEPKPVEPTKHQYDYDVATAMAFLQKHDLQDYFKMNIEANHATLAGHTFDHELAVARDYNALGSIDANQGDLLLGWDTDEFPTNVLDTTLAMHQILENGGIAPGGINFDAKVRRTSFEMEDLFMAHIAGMDTYARGLKNAYRLKEDGFFDKVLHDKYKYFTDTQLGKDILADKENLESLSEHALTDVEIPLYSTKLEFVKSVLNDYLD